MRKSRKQQQRLLRNMGAHAVVLELLQIPYEKVGLCVMLTGFSYLPCIFLNLLPADWMHRGWFMYIYKIATAQK